MTHDATPPPRIGYRIREAAVSLGVSERQVRRFIADGTLDARRLGGRVVIPAGALHALLDEAPSAAG